MAADYFFDNTQRDRINETIQRALEPMKQQADTNLQARLKSAVQNLVSLAVASSFLLLGWLMIEFLLPAVGSAIGPWLIAVLALLALVLFAGGLPQLLTVTVAYLIPVVMTTSLGLVLKFLIRCPKGSVFGIGFLFLVASFACRWYNL